MVMSEVVFSGLLTHCKLWATAEEILNFRVAKFQNVTLPALLKTFFVDMFFEFAWEFCVEKWRGFWVNFSGLRFPRNRARKLKFSGEISEQNSGLNSGNSKNSGNFRSATFLT